MIKKQELYDLSYNFRNNFFKLVGISSQTIKWSQENIFKHIRNPPLPPLVQGNKKTKKNSIKFKGEGKVKIDKEFEKGIWKLFV
jgi:hypothetical protein